MIISRADKNDLQDILTLYTQLHDNPMPLINDYLTNLWDEILSDKNHFIIVGKEDGRIVSSCVMIVVPNLTHSLRPYAIIENVITDEAHRGKGYASRILDFARETAVRRQCYKIMLMTGSKEDKTLNFYKHAGYNCEDKTAFIMWL